MKLLSRKSTKTPVIPGRCRSVLWVVITLVFLISLGSQYFLYVSLTAVPNVTAESSSSSSKQEQQQQQQENRPYQQQKQQHHQQQQQSSKFVGNKSEPSNPLLHNININNLHANEDVINQMLSAAELQGHQQQIPVTGGAFVHIGKTGGSSLSVLLRNGCHSYMPHPCRNISLETAASLLIESYYHVPDFGLLPQSHHSFYVLTVRDPFERTVSAFTWEHLSNRLARNETLGMNLYEKYEAAYLCFPTLESWVHYLGGVGDGGDSSEQSAPEVFSYPYPKQLVIADSCQDLARAALFGKVKLYNHLFFRYHKIKELIPNIAAQTLFVTRQEHLWEDWTSIHHYLEKQQQAQHHQQNFVDSAEKTLLPIDKVISELKHSKTAVIRNTTHYALKKMLPVTRELSSAKYKMILCRALREEYQAYLWLIQHARNLDETDRHQTIREAHEKCPNVVPAPSSSQDG